MNSTKSETVCSISFVDMPILGFLILNRTFHFHVPLSTSCMEILFALVRSSKLTLGHRASVPAWKSQIYVLEGVSSDGWTVQGDEQNALNISRRIIRIYNPTSFDDYNVTKVVENLEFIANDTREIRNVVSANPFRQWSYVWCSAVCLVGVFSETVYEVLLSYDKYMRNVDGFEVAGKRLTRLFDRSTLRFQSRQQATDPPWFCSDARFVASWCRRLFP